MGTHSGDRRTKGGGRERHREKDTSHSLAGRPQLVPMVWLELTCSGFFTQKTVLSSCWSALRVGVCAEPAREGWCPLGMEGRTRPQLRPLQGVGGPKLGPRRPLSHVLCLLLQPLRSHQGEFRADDGDLRGQAMNTSP